MNKLVKEFVDSVGANPLRYNEAVRLCVERHIKDLQSTENYYFDEAEAERAIRFVCLLRHTKGAWAKKKFALQPFQAFTLWVLFGWRRNDNGARRFRKSYIEIPRKNGKTEFAAAVAIYLAFFDKEEGAEVFTAATKRDQAKICFDACQTMIRHLQHDSARAKETIKAFRNTIFSEQTRSKIEPLSADYDTLDGLNPHCAIIDEYHAHKTDGLLKVIETGMGSRLQPLLFIITTAGFNKESPCFNLRRVCLDILKGSKTDETVFALIFGIEEGDEWDNEATWEKANPNLGITPYIEYMQSQCTKARNEGRTAEIEFRTKNLNEWTTVASTWISDLVWENAGGAFDATELRGRLCFGGLDLATTRDLSALCLLFPPENEDEKIKVLLWFWCPEENAKTREKSDGVPYSQWAADGYLHLTEGNVTDYNFIKSKIRQLNEEYTLHSIAYDRYNASQLVIDLQDEGARMSPFSQRIGTMSAPTKELERMVADGSLTHGGNPVLAWMNRNVAIKTDADGNIKIDKDKSQEKVDGMVALAMSIGEYMTWKHSVTNAFNNENDLTYL